MEGYWGEAVEIRYEAGRNIDNILTYFWCDIFHFRDIKGRSPEVINQKYQTLLVTISRASLESFWSRNMGVIQGNMSMLNKITWVS